MAGQFETRMNIRIYSKYDKRWKYCDVIVKKEGTRTSARKGVKEAVLRTQAKKYGLIEDTFGVSLLECDRSGTEIFEGDIVESDGVQYLVYWDDEFDGINCKNLYTGENPKPYLTLQECKIVGNRWNCLDIKEVSDNA